MTHKNQVQNQMISKEQYNVKTMKQYNPFISIHKDEEIKRKKSGITSESDLNQEIKEASMNLIKKNSFLNKKRKNSTDIHDFKH